MPAKRATQGAAVRQRPRRRSIVPVSQQFSAQDAALGYLYQIRLALLLLLRAGVSDPDTAVSIELLDDVAFETNGTPTELIQSKHHLRGRGSLSDSSSDLWKTIRIWSELFRERRLDPSATLLTLLTSSSAPDGSAASWLRPAGTGGQRDVEAALIRLQSVAATSMSEMNSPAYAAFTSLTQTQQRALLEAICVLDSQPNITGVRDEAIKELTYAARPDHREAVYERLEGWWFQSVVAHLTARPSNPIPHTALQAKVHDIREQFQQDNLPIDFPDNLELTESDLSTTQRVFVKQLKLVNVGGRQVQFAISDFYRAFQQRSRWIRDELLPPDDLERYERLLINEWERRFQRTNAQMSPNSPEEEEKQERGRSLVDWAEDANYPIRPRCLEQYICRGSFHILANQLRVGWHSDFRERLAKKVPKRAKGKTTC